MPANPPNRSLLSRLHDGDPRAIARAITQVENSDAQADAVLAGLDQKRIREARIIGLTGPPGVGKSTLTGRLVRLFREQEKRVGVLAVDPTSPLSGGAILGDRIRMMEHATDRDVVVRSMASRGSLGGICRSAAAAARIFAASGCSIVLVETVGVGQSEIDIAKLADITLLVTAPGMGDDIQALKAGVLEVADLIVVNKADHPGADTTALEMENVFQERETAGEAAPRVLKTVASEGRGVEELCKEILNHLDLLNESGEGEKRRAQSYRNEAIDWAMEGIRALVTARINDLDDATLRTPNKAAAQVVEYLLRRDKDNESK